MDSAEVEIVAKTYQRNGGLEILEREMTTATHKISMDEMEGLSFASVDQALQGQIAGLDVVFGSGDVGSGTQMRLRGNSMLEGDATPLIVVDENIWEVDDGSFDFEAATEDKFAELLMINTDDIAMLAPVSVHADHFHQHVGKTMLTLGIQKVKEFGFKGITVEGDYHFYNQVGFRTSSEFGIYPTSGFPMQEPRCMMCQETSEGSLKDIGGYVVYDMYYNA